MLLHRILTALVGVPAVLAAIWFGPPWLTLLAAAAALIGVREAYRLHPPTPMPEPTPTTDAFPSSSFRRKPESRAEIDALPSSSFRRKPESVAEIDALPSSSFRRKPESVAEIDALPSSSFRRKPESEAEMDAFPSSSFRRKPESVAEMNARPSSSFRRKPESVAEIDALPSSSFRRKPESGAEIDGRNADAGDTDNAGNADSASNDDNDAPAPAFRHTRLPLLLGGAWAVALVLAGELAGSAADFARAAAGICIAGVIIASLWMVAAWHGRRPLTAMLYLSAAPVYIGGALACAVALRGIVGAEVELPLPTAGAALPDSPQPGIPLLDETLFDDPGTPPPVALTDLASSDLPPADLALAMDGGEIAEIGELPAQQQTGSAVQPNGGGNSVGDGGVWLLPAIAGGGFAVAAANLLTAGGWWLLLGILTVYAADTGAYAVGRRFGRHPMAPGISPGKSWEGAAGGMAGAVIAAVVLGLLFPVRLQIWQLAGIGVILGIVSPLGDLLESKIKRRAGVKDSGGLFPGHGGMLDRLDSLLPSLMVVYLLALLLAPQP